MAAKSSFSVSQATIVERVEVRVALDPYLDLRALVQYSGLAKRTLQTWLHHPDLPLPHYDVGGKVLVRQSEFDRWIQQLKDPRSMPFARSNCRG
ncbi:MAG: helix-turn-helix domain-containing protein [Nitrospira sp.]|nr:helix-turn-helix domain-containing protein [Nitrospira sp.]